MLQPCVQQIHPSLQFAVVSQTFIIHNFSVSRCESCLFCPLRCCLTF